MALQPFFTQSSYGVVMSNCAIKRESLKTSRLPLIELVQNDTGPQLLMTLKDSNTGELLDLSRDGTEILFHFSMGLNAEIKAIIPMLPGPNAELGEAMLDWTMGTSQVMSTVGDYYGEVQITWPDGRIQTTLSKLKFRIHGELG